MEHNESAKIAQTKRIIAEKFTELLESKSIKKISVNDICQKALMSRSAFYLHFQDKYAVLKYCLERDFASFEAALSQKPIDEFIYSVLDYVQSNKTLCYNAFFAETSEELTSIFHNTLYNSYYKALKHKQEEGGQVPEPLSFTASYYVGAIVGSVLHWLIHEPDTDIETIAALQKRLLPEWMS